MDQQQNGQCQKGPQQNVPRHKVMYPKRGLGLAEELLRLTPMTQQNYGLTKHCKEHKRSFYHKS